MRPGLKAVINGFHEPACFKMQLSDKLFTKLLPLFIGTKMRSQDINRVQKHLGHFTWNQSFNSHESLWHRSSPLPQYCFPFVFRLALTGQSVLGFRMMLKICFPVHRAMGWWADSVRRGSHRRYPRRPPLYFTFIIAGRGREILTFSSLPTRIDAKIWQAFDLSKNVSFNVKRYAPGNTTTCSELWFLSMVKLLHRKKR